MPKPKFRSLTQLDIAGQLCLNDDFTLGRSLSKSHDGSFNLICSCAGPEGERGPDGSPERITKYRVLSNTGLDPLKNHKATKPAFNVGPSSAYQRNDIWRFVGGPMMASL